MTSILESAKTLLHNESFIIGILSSVVVTIIVFIAKQLVQVWEHRSDATGQWYSHILDDNNMVVKSDWYILYHNKRTHIIKGTMRRIWPINQSDREWNVAGMLKNSTLIAYSYTDKLETSTAAMLARLNQPKVFTGYYLRYNEDSKKIEKIRIRLTKVSPKIKSKDKVEKYQKELIESFQTQTHG